MFETFSASGLEISEKSCQISKSFLSFPFFQPSKNIVHDIQSETQRNVVDVQHRILHISWILKTRFSKESYESGVRRQKCTIAFAGRFRTISLSLKGLFLSRFGRCCCCFDQSAWQLSNAIVFQSFFFLRFKLLTSQRHDCYRSNDSFQYFLPPKSIFCLWCRLLPRISFTWDFRPSSQALTFDSGRCLIARLHPDCLRPNITVGNRQPPNVALTFGLDLLISGRMAKSG